MPSPHRIDSQGTPAIVMRLAARPVGAQRSSRTPLAAGILRIELTMVDLADTRAAGDHQRLRHQRQADCHPLTVSELQFRGAFRSKGLPSLRQSMARQPAVHDADQPIGDHLLRPARNVQVMSPTLSAITAPSDCSSSRAVRINSFGASSSSSASGIN
jgi:hypothetical protein